MNLEEKREYVYQNYDKIPEIEKQKFKDNFVYSFIKNTSCIEGEHITLAEVIKIVETNQVSIDSNIQRSVYNNYFAYMMIEEKALAHTPIDEVFFKDVHERLLQDISVGGLYRNVDITINGSKHIPCSYLKVYDRMGKFFYDINNFNGSPIELASYTHLQIAKVHPFLDANGRMARLFMNYQLIANGYLPIIVNAKEKKEYFNCLEEFKVNKNEQLFIDFIEEHLNKEYDKMINLINCYNK